MHRELSQSYDKIKNLLEKLKKDFSNEEIEASLIYYYLLSISKLHKEPIFNLKKNVSQKIISETDIVFKKNIHIYDLAFLFEIIIDDAIKNINGIVFTPKFITEFIIENLLKEENKIDNKMTIIDPACGTSIFLLVALELLSMKFSKDKLSIIKENLFGIDIFPENIRRSKILLKLACIDELSEENEITFNLKEANSLTESWDELFNQDGFDYIIGNPPYVNPHDLDKETREILKKNYKTTKTGTTNIFYAFIEKSMNFIKKTGKVSFIIPNNFLTINAAKDLRIFLKDNFYIDYVLDFTQNTPFKPIRTYNAIIVLSKSKKDKLKYSLLPLVSDIKKALTKLDILEIEYEHLDEHRWNLLEKAVLNNIKTIENIGFSIKNMIKTGIATLKDKDYILDGFDKCLDMYFKNLNGSIFYIDPEIVKPLYKISEVRLDGDISDYQKFIIFPYEKLNLDKYTIIPEEKLRIKYTSTYKYLLAAKENLDTRDKGKPNPVAWYAYGRSQGINNVGKKLIYPTFANYPKFSLVEDEATLFCNGYAIFESNEIELQILQKILNSSVMKYYVDNTSYPIEGGYMCYQKKYIERFSIPILNESEKFFLLNEKDNNAIDDFLTKKYCLVI